MSEEETKQLNVMIFRNGQWEKVGEAESDGLHINCTVEDPEIRNLLIETYNSGYINAYSIEGEE